MDVVTLIAHIVVRAAGAVYIPADPSGRWVGSQFFVERSDASEEELGSLATVPTARAFGLLFAMLPPRHLLTWSTSVPFA